MNSTMNIEILIIQLTKVWTWINILINLQTRKGQSSFWCCNEPTDTWITHTRNCRHHLRSMHPEGSNSIEQPNCKFTETHIKINRLCMSNVITVSSSTQQYIITIQRNMKTMPRYGRAETWTLEAYSWSIRWLPRWDFLFHFPLSRFEVFNFKT